VYRFSCHSRDAAVPASRAFNPAVARGRELLQAEFSNLDKWWSRPDVWSLGHHVPCTPSSVRYNLNNTHLESLMMARRCG
jgi:hypothetical protein